MTACKPAGTQHLLSQQGEEETLQLEPVNGYYRRLQYQYLGSRGSPGAAGFVVEVHTSCLGSVGGFSVA